MISLQLEVPLVPSRSQFLISQGFQRFSLVACNNSSAKPADTDSYDSSYRTMACDCHDPGFYSRLQLSTYYGSHGDLYQDGIICATFLGRAIFVNCPIPFQRFNLDVFAQHVFCRPVFRRWDINLNGHAACCFWQTKSVYRFLNNLFFIYLPT